MAKVKTLKLKFDGSSSADVVGYKLYVEEAPNAVSYTSKSFDLGNRTVVPLEELPGIGALDGTYNLGLTAVDDAGNESDLQVLENIALDFFAPAAPTNFDVIAE